jgi:polysaccharide deacetylase family protein (PEP-CTERM system associated)
VTIVNAFTVDLEEWFQGLTSTNPRTDQWARYEARLEAASERLLTLLSRRSVHATFFVLGHVATYYPSLIRRIDASGHEIAVHGYWHRKVHRLTPEEFGDELDRALETVAPLCSHAIIGHRAPYFSINGESRWAIGVLRERGFCYDSSFFPTRNMLYGYPDSPRFPHRIEGSTLVEFPLSTARWLGLTVPVSGGFYMRALPYAVVRQGIRQLNRQGHPAIIYVHPWELDTEQHYGRVTPRERLTHYYGRAGLGSKLDRLFDDFEFVPLGELYQQYLARHGSERMPIEGGTCTRPKPERVTSAPETT